MMIEVVLSCHPRFIISDETITALDTTVQGDILYLFKDFQKNWD